MYEYLSKPLKVEKNIKLYTGTGNPELARRIANILHLELSGLRLEKFANGETYARFEESIRGDEVFFIQSIAGQNINDLLMECLVVADAATRASVGALTAVIPHYAYARQDRKADSREPITSRLVANLLETAGFDRIITLDLHQGQIQGFFDIPVTHLTALYLLGDYFMVQELRLEGDGRRLPRHGSRQGRQEALRLPGLLDGDRPQEPSAPQRGRGHGHHR